MMFRDIKKQLRGLKPGHGRISPDRVWVMRNRETLLAQIKNTVHTVDEPKHGFSGFARGWSQLANLFIPDRFVSVSRMMSMAMIVGFAAVGGWIASVSASSDSLPGEVLYHVKIATEKTELIFASVGGVETRVETLLRHASNRVDEYQKSKTPDQASVAIESLKKSIASTNESLDGIDSESGETAVAVAKVVNEKTEELLQSIGNATNGEPGEAVTPENSKELGEATHLIEVTGVKAVEVLVEKNLASGGQIDLSDVKASVEKKLERLVTDLSEINKNIAAASTAVASSTSSSSVPLVVTTTTDVLGTTVSTTAGITAKDAIKATEQKLEEANKVVEKGVAEAKTLIGQNDLLGAIKKVQAMTEVKNDAGSVVLEAKIITNTLIQTEGAATTPSTTLPTNTTTTATQSKE